MGGAFLRIVAASSRGSGCGRRSGEALPCVPPSWVREGILEGLFCAAVDVEVVVETDAVVDVEALKTDETELESVCRLVP